MRILVTHTDFPLSSVSRVLALHKFLRMRGDELIVVEMTARGTPYDFAYPDPAHIEGLKWTRLFERESLRDLPPVKASNALWQTLDRLNANLVLAGAFAYTPGATAIRWGRMRRRPVVIMDDARLQDVPRPRLVNWVKRRIFENVDAVLTSAPSHSDSYLAWGLPQDRIFFGLDVVNNNWFAEKAKEVRAKEGSRRPRYELPEKYFLGIGRQVPKKNWSTLIEAYSKYRQSSRRPPWSLVLVGDGQERNGLETQVARDRIEGVHFFPFCNQEEACAYYAMAGCLVLPSFYGETWGLVVNEAMSCSLPVLVSNQCGCAETLVQDSRNGWKFSPFDPDELAERLLQVANLSTADLTAMGGQSRSISSEWNLDRFVKGAIAAIEACKVVSRGFCSILDRAILTLWKGRYRPT